MTDEGFYIHNARNIALFGQARTDGFNNMLTSPVLHFGQIAVFKAFGVGSVQARLISVACSLITLALLWAAVRRALGDRIAVTATLFLGLDHVNLLYNRMALQDTPASLLAVMGLYCFVRGTGSETDNRARRWLIASGALIALTVTARSVCIYLIPLPFIALIVQAIQSTKLDELNIRTSEGEFGRNGLLVMALAMCAVFALYLLFWYWPHHAELAAVNAFYSKRAIPGSLSRLGGNIYRALLGSSWALSAYLFRHTPILFILALLGLLVRPKTRASSAEIYLAAWLGLGWILLSTSSYAPSRYYVTTYPALAAMAAIALWRLPEIGTRLRQARMHTRVATAGLIWFVIYHAVAMLLDHYGALSRGWARALLYIMPSASLIFALRFSILTSLAQPLALIVKSVRPRITFAVIALWLLFNTYWLGSWLLGLDYSQYRMSRWLAESLPPGSVLIGDVAPGVCLDNTFIAVHVEPGVCNDVLPIETMGAQYPNASRYIIMDDRWKYTYWMAHYPELVGPDRLIKKARVLKWKVGVYSVER